MSENEWTKILGWRGYRVYRSEINEEGKTLRYYSGCDASAGTASWSVLAVVGGSTKLPRLRMRDAGLPWSEYRMRAVCADMWEPFRQSLGQWVPEYRSSMRGFTFCSMPVGRWTKVRQTEFFRKSGAARDLVRGKRRLLFDQLVQPATAAIDVS
jgi:hypothetical protein